MAKFYLGREVEVLDGYDPSGNLTKIRFKGTNEYKVVHKSFIKYKEDNKMSEKLERGTKVVPHKKSYGCVLEGCHHWKRAKEQGFLYVLNTEKDEYGKELYVLSSKLDNNSFGGNYYLREDFTLFEEEEEKEEKLTYNDIDRILEFTADECRDFNAEMTSWSREDLIGKLKDNQSIVAIDISPDDTEYDPHFNLQGLKNLHEWIGNILKYIDEEIEKPKEMTLEEIEEVLGHKVIIKDNQ